jgi:hypothetical protein
MNRRLYGTGYYSRNIGMLRKEDYDFIRDCLENYLAYLQSQDVDNSEEIDRLKISFIKLDHTISRL